MNRPTAFAPSFSSVRARGATLYGVLAAAVLLAVLAAAVLIGHWLREGEVSNLRSELAALQSDLGEAQRATGASEAEVGLLDTRVAELNQQLAGLSATLAQQERDLGARSAEIVSLRATLTDSGLAEVATIRANLATLQHDYDLLAAEHGLLQQQWSRLQQIDTGDLSSDPLYVDLSSGDVVYTRALCTGSMEPTITCDDLLIMYKPQSTTDLDVGDVIYFRKPTADCSGHLQDRFTLHRVIDVRSTSSGIFFQTKGDAFAFPDGCLVPAQDVIYKLLTSVRDSRVVE